MCVMGDACVAEVMSECEKFEGIMETKGRTEIMRRTRNETEEAQ